MNRERIISLVIAVALLVGFGAMVKAHGESGATDSINSTVAAVYHPDKQEAAFRTGIAVVDTLTSAGILATPDFVVGNRETACISARFSQSGDSCKIVVFRVWKNKDGTNFIKGRSVEYTLSGGTTQMASVYMAPDQNVDTAGATDLRICVTSAPAASMDLWVGSY